jgi:hypothetical protein
MKFRILLFTIIAVIIFTIFLFFLPKKTSKIISPAFRKITPTITLSPTPTPSPIPTLTPTPTLIPTPTPIPLTSEDLENLFTKYAAFYSVDKNFLRKIAFCESEFNPNASADDYLGLFQFSTNTWITTRTLMGQDSNPNLRTNAEESIKTASFKISRGESKAWPTCTK